MNDKKQLDCQLNCKASAQLSESIMLDLALEDRNLEEVLNEQQLNDKQDTGNSSDNSDRNQ